MTHYINPSHLAAVLGGDVNGNHVSAPGPNNVDKRNDRSMSITVDPDAPDGFLVHSYSGKNSDMECKEYVRSKLGLPEWKPEKSDRMHPLMTKATVVCHYEYQDEQAHPYLRVTRMSDKGFVQSHWDLDRYEWVKGKPKGPPVPYRLPEIIARPDDTIWLVEGEKDADNLAALGLLATTAPGGGSAFPLTPDFGKWFDGRKVIAIADNDPTGARWRDRVSQAVADVTHISMPAPHKDVTDWLTAGGTVEALQDMALYPAEQMTIGLTEGHSVAKVTPTPFQWIDPSAIQPRAWLYGHHLIRRFVSVTVSPGGLGKSSLELVEALAMTSGRDLLVDDKVRTPEPLRVWYWNGEDPQDETQRRVVAAAMHHGIKPDDFASRLFTDTGREQAVTLGEIAAGKITLDEDLFDDLEAEILARQIDVFILDPFVSSHRMGENDNNAIDAIVKRLGKLAERANCAVEIVHHVRKPSGGNKDATDVNDARGASALIGGVRSARVLNVMSEEIASNIPNFNIEDRFSYFSVTNGKANMSKRSADAKWRHLHDLDLCNGPVGVSDHVGVVEHYALPEKAHALASLPHNAAMIAQRAVHDAPHAARFDKQAADWVGHLLGKKFGIDSVDKSGQATLLIAIKTWIQSGVLVVEIAKDGKGNPRQYVRCPENEIPMATGLSTPEPEEYEDPF